MIILRKGNYTWYIHDNWLIFVLALITYIIRLVVNQIRKKRLKSENTQVWEISNVKSLSFKLEDSIRWSLLIYTIILIINQIKKRKKSTEGRKTSTRKNWSVKVRGGDNIVTCFDIDGIYEVQKDSLIITIRRILKIKKNKTPLFIEPAVLFLAYMVDRQVKNLTLLHGLYGIDVFIENSVSAALWIGIGAGIMGVIFALTPLAAFPAFGTVEVTSILAFVLLTSSFNLKCDEYFYQLPQFQDGISYIDREKIYIKGHKDLPGFKLEKKNWETCTS